MTFKPTTNPCFIDLDGSAELFGVQFSHGGSDPVAQVPGRFIGYIHGPFDLVGRYAFLGLNHHVHDREPLGERKMGVMKDRACRDREPIATGVTIKLATGIDAGNTE